MDESDFWAGNSSTDDSEVDSDGEPVPQQPKHPDKQEWKNKLTVKWNKLCMTHKTHLLCDLRCRETFACMIAQTSVLRIQFDRLHLVNFVVVVLFFFFVNKN